ncbi:MAG: endonuclease domain-containing protein [Selenomonadaceae bacterium]|nr:endonuclease domain-containing protein [Selenomonadaceae bacterium]
MTVEERRLWYDFLRHYPVKFYRQHIIDNYIADFFCHQAKLVIEVDGSQHYTAAGQIYDQHRTAELRKHNLLVIRFTNLDIKDRFREVCDMIDSVVSERIGFNPWGAEPPLQQS